MALTVKQGRHKDSSVRANPAPDQVLAPLPASVLERFPELEQWQQDNQARLDQWKDALDRRQRELEDRIAQLE